MTKWRLTKHTPARMVWSHNREYHIDAVRRQRFFVQKIQKKLHFIMMWLFSFVIIGGNRMKDKPIIFNFSYTGTDKDFDVFILSLIADYLEKHNLVNGARPNIKDIVYGGEWSFSHI